MYHALWHFVRNQKEWEKLPIEEKQPLIDEGWSTPRFTDQLGAGIDFLFMHRNMISMVNEWAKPPVEEGHHHAFSPIVVGWIDVPWDHADPVWPMPKVDLMTDPVLTKMFGRSKDPVVTAQYQQRCIDRYNNRNWLRSVTLDSFGTELESSIHGWFHMHWSSSPPADPNSLDTTNDWLGSPFSSHVNRHFWKLHGWIDDRIKAWEDANGTIADISSGWDGPTDYVTGEIHSADPKFFTILRFDKKPPLLMPWKDILLEVPNNSL